MPLTAVPLSTACSTLVLNFRHDQLATLPFFRAFLELVASFEQDISDKGVKWQLTSIAPIASRMQAYLGVKSGGRRQGVK